jgi:hypothetical protein
MIRVIILQIQEQLIQDSTKTTGLSVHETYLIIAIIALVGALVSTVLYIKTIHKSHNEKQDENIEKMAVAMTNSTNAINNNTKVVDMMYHELHNLSKR